MKKRFSKLLSEVAQPKAGDEKHFKDKHVVEKLPHSHAGDEVFKGSTKKTPKRRADYETGNDEKVYEGMDPVNKKAALGKFKNRADKDIDNDGDVDSSDRYLHNRRKAVTKAIHKIKEAHEKLQEKAESEAQAIAARIALKHKREGTKPEAGSASADMMKMSEKDLEDFTKMKKGAPYKVKEEVELDEKVYASDYNVGHEKSQFGGYRPHVTHKKTGRTMYLGQTSYKKPEHAKGHASAYLKGYEQMGDRTASRMANEYEKANKKHVHESVELDEISRNTVRSYIRKASAAEPDRYTKKSGKTRRAGIELAGKKAYDIGGKAKVPATESVELEEDITKMSHGRLKWHMNTGTPHGSYSKDEMKAERDRRLKYKDSADAYRKAKSGLNEDAWEEIPMMTRQLQFIMYAAEEVMEYLNDCDDMCVDPEEWFQNKLAHVHGQMTTLHAYIEGDRRMNMMGYEMYGEEVELDEVTDQERLSARKIQRDAQTARHGIARKPGESMVAYLTRAKKHKEKMQKEEVELDEVTRSAVKRPENYTDAQGRTRTRYTTTRPVQHDQYGQEKMRESLEEAVKPGRLKLDDGSAITVSKKDADLLNQMFNDLNAKNRKSMMDTMMSDKDGFNEIVGFAREAL